ncbi:MAG: ribbon-helix-helix domain-containing protein [Acidobacteriota bacterium]
MRTIIELPVEQLDALDALCAREGISRAEAVRRSVAEYVRAQRASSPEQAFGLWRGHPVDGLAYEAQLRREWDSPVSASPRTRKARGRAATRRG